MDKIIYMNNAATSWPKAPGVAEAAAGALREPPGAMRRGGLDTFDVFDEVRRRLAPLLGVSSPHRIALGSNATWGLNLGILGVPLKAGDVILTTAAEHNSVLRPVYARGQREGLEVVYVPAERDGRVDPDRWADAVRMKRPRLAVMTHASNVTGAVQPIQEMAEAARDAGAMTLLDASQSLGLLPVRAEETGFDMVAFTGHKYLLGPQGTGGLWVREGLTLEPALTGGTGIHSDSDLMPEDMPLRLEAGTGNEPSFHGLLAALRWAEENPGDPEAECRRFVRLRQGLRDAGAQVIGPDPESLGGSLPAFSPVVSFNVPGETAGDVGYMLQMSYDIVCRTGLHCAPRIFPCLGVPESVRLSLSRFTTDEEVETAIEAVEAVLG